MKNHHRDSQGRLLQTNKKWSDLKISQQEYISNYLREKYLSYVITNGRKPSKIDREQILDEVYDKITERNVWIPKQEVNNYFNGKVTGYLNSLANLGHEFAKNKL